MMSEVEIEDEYVILQPAQTSGDEPEQGSSRVRLDGYLDTSELCCMCRLCLSRNDADSERVVNSITNGGSDITSISSDIVYSEN